MFRERVNALELFTNQGTSVFSQLWTKLNKIVFDLLLTDKFHSKRGSNPTLCKDAPSSKLLPDERWGNVPQYSPGGARSGKAHRPCFGRDGVSDGMAFAIMMARKSKGKQLPPRSFVSFAAHGASQTLPCVCRC